MNVVVKQGFWTSIIGYLGAILGMVNQLFIYPKYLEPDQVGLFSQIQSFAFLVAPLAILGMTSTAIRYTPVFKENENNKKALITYLFIGASVGTFIVISLALLFSDYISGWYEEKAPLVSEYYKIGVVLIGVFTFMTLNESIAKANFQAVLPNLLKDVLVRSLGFILVLLYGSHFISFEQAVYGIILLYIPSSIILIIYNIKQKHVSFTLNLAPVLARKRELRSYALYSVLGSVGSVLMLNIDVQMISALVDLDATGIYTRAFYMAVMIELPRRAISQIASPVISKAFKNNEMAKINILYKKLSINQTIIGVLIFLGVTINLDNIYSLMNNGETYKLGTNVVYFIGFSKLVDMFFSVNGEIISMSKHYRYNTLAIIALSILAILLNFLLIPIYGFNGAAYASLISIVAFNLLKAYFVWIKFRMSPLSINNLYILLVGAGVWLLNQYIPVINNGILDILVRSIIVTVLYCALVVFLRLSEDVNTQVDNFFRKFKQ